MYTVIFLLINNTALCYIIAHADILYKIATVQKKISNIIEHTPDTLTLCGMKSELSIRFMEISQINFVWYSEHVALICLFYIVFYIYDPITLNPRFSINHPPDAWQIFIPICYFIFMGYFCNEKLTPICMVIHNCKTYPNIMVKLDNFIRVLTQLEEGLINDNLSYDQTMDYYAQILSIINDFGQIILNVIV